MGLGVLGRRGLGRVRLLVLLGAFAQAPGAAQTPPDTTGKEVLQQPSLEALQRAFGAEPSSRGEGSDAPAQRRPRLRSIVVETEAPPMPRTVAIAIPFQINSADLSTDAVGVLDPLATVLREVTRESRVVIEGHTDATGSAELNRRLSLARAQTVLRALVAREVHAAHLRVEGHGADRLLADRAPADPAHRRVQFRVEVLP
jgi:outer membrane protein OmpA-like peptidoglycan-associated protein